MSKNEDVLRGVTDDAKVRPSILDPRTKRWRIFSLEEAWVDRTPVGKIIDDTIFENSMLTKFRSRYVSGFVALSHLMPQIEVDHSRPASPQVKVIEDLFMGDITRSIADHNDKMPSHLRLRIPYAVPHIGYEADGVPRRQTEACAAVFLSVILGEGAIAGSEIRHALRPIDVSPEGSDQLEHDL